MTTAIYSMWWIFLILALLVTLVDVYLLLRVIRLSRQIKTLTGKTLPAAVGIVQNTDAGEALSTTAALTTALREKVGQVVVLTAELQRKLQGGT